MNRKTHAIAILAILLLATLLVTVTAVRATAELRSIDPPIGQTILFIHPDESQRAAESAWSTGERRAAQPHALNEVTPEILESAFSTLDATPSMNDVPGYAPGSPALLDADSTARVEFPEEWQETTPADSGDQELNADFGKEVTSSGTGAYTAFFGNKYAPMWKFHPYKAIGKLFFDTPQGPSFCTATVIGPDLALTAAQCILDTNSDTIYTNFSFCPAARGTSCPYGTFAWQGAYMQSTYRDAVRWQDAINVDVALVLLQSNRAGRSVHSYTGWLGRAWNLSPSQHSFAFGYPVSKLGSPYSYICAGESYTVRNENQEMGCDGGSGHLGGPWLVNFAPYSVESANYVSSLTSYQYTRGRNSIGGPHFSLENIAGICDVIPGC